MVTFKKIFNSNLSYIFLCLFFTFLIYGGRGGIGKLGLYSDDWDRISIYAFRDVLTPLNKISYLVSNNPTIVYRITQILIYPFSSILGDVIDNQILAMHIVSLTLNFFLLVVMYFLILEINGEKFSSFLFAVFIFTMPGRSSNFFWPSTQVEMLSILFFFVALLVHFNSKLKLYASVILIFIFTLLSAWSYEITIFLPGIFMLFFLLKGERRTFLHLISSMMATLLIIFFKFYIYPNILNLDIIKKTQISLSIPEIFDRVLEVSKVLLYKVNLSSMFSYWGDHFGTLSFIVLVAFFVALLVMMILSDNKVFERDGSSILFFIGSAIIFGFVFSITPAFSHGSLFGFYGKNSRFLSFPMMGFGFVICYLLSPYFFSRRNSRYITYFLFIILIFLNVKSIESERLAYIRSWEIQKRVLKNIDFSSIKGDRSVMIFVSNTEDLRVTDYDVSVFEDFWTLSFAFSLYSGNPNVEANFASYPYGRLDYKGGYQSRNWGKNYYEKEDIYQVNLNSAHPIVIPVQRGIR